MVDNLIITTDDGSFSAYVARPPRKDAPAVVVLHEVFGVNTDMRQTCDELTAAGFLAVCPDLFWRIEPGLDLNSRSERDVARAYDLYAKYDRDIGARDIAQVVRATAVAGSTGKVGLLGFCLGGLMAYLAGARGPIDAVVAYHGGDTEKYLDEADTLSAPMLMHLAEQDEYITPAAQAEIKSALAQKADVVIETYEGCNHAFARHGGSHYDAKAAALANRRSLSFLTSHLG
jgi:carboxymethylenebutenolidase